MCLDLKSWLCNKSAVFFGQIYHWNWDTWMECKIFKRNVRTKLGSLLKFKVKDFLLLITKVSIYKYSSYNSISDCNGTRTHNHVACKQTPNHLAKLASLVKCLSDCVFQSRCSHLNFRYRTYFQQGVPWHSTWHDNNMLKFFYRKNLLI